MGAMDSPVTFFGSQIKRTVQISTYKTRFTDDGTYTYVGIAAPNSATSSAVWAIKRIENSTGNIDYADGDLNFNNIWDNVTTLDYS